MGTIADYFERDLTGYATVEWTLGAQVSPQNSASIRGRMHIDFRSMARFTSFLLPEEMTQVDTVGATARGVLQYVMDQSSQWSTTNITLPPAGTFFFKDRLKIENTPQGVSLEVLPVEGGRASARSFPYGRAIHLYCHADFSSAALEALRSDFEGYGFFLRFRGPTYARERATEDRPNAFISHDSRDKDAIARPLARALAALGYTVWFDEFSLKPGESLRESIEAGIMACRRCVFVLTPNFLRNSGWPKSEFNAVFTRELVERESVIIPLWAGVGKTEVYEYSPVLADRVAVKWEGDNPAEAAARAIAGVLAPNPKNKPILK